MGTMTTKITRRLVALMAPKGARARELFYLRRRYAAKQARIDAVLSLPQPLCCHYCAYPWLSKAQDAQERRRARMAYLERRSP